MPKSSTSFREKHGGWSKHRYAYSSWRAMMSRCYKETDGKYKNYGARGIVVCERWHDFNNFIADMGDRVVGLSIGRKDNNKNYEPENCEWQTWDEQNNNRRDNIFIEFQGQHLTVSQWAKKIGMDKTALKRRFVRGWPIEKALTYSPNANRIVIGKS